MHVFIVHIHTHILPSAMFCVCVLILVSVYMCDPTLFDLSFCPIEISNYVVLTPPSMVTVSSLVCVGLDPVQL